MSRMATIRALTYTINMMEKHSTMTISCSDSMITMLKEARDHLIRKTPVEEIVQCKDCKHGEKANSVYLCGKSRGFGIAHEPDWFCADGERKE